MPGGGDVYILKHVLHDWSDEACVRILRSCRRGLAPGGKVLVVDAVLPPGNEPHPGKALDVAMMTLVDGRERGAGRTGRAVLAGESAPYTGPAHAHLRLRRRGRRALARGRAADLATAESGRPVLVPYARHHGRRQISGKPIGRNGQGIVMDK
ncbi:hypothetical protein GCM10020000_74290 [Streptomyces olivoverticillatus]